MAAFGYDIASDKTRLNAITRAFNSGELSVTSRITVVQETGNQFEVLLLQPTYYQDAPLNTPQERWEHSQNVSGKLCLAHRNFFIALIRCGSLGLFYLDC